jgi:hypothetical protein
MIKTKIAFAALGLSCFAVFPARADFGDADFPVEMFAGGAKSYHDAWCRKVQNNCRVRFQGPAMWVEGQGGIRSNQYITFRYDKDGEEYYNYLTYLSSNGQERVALFLFANSGAHKEFVRALFKWKRQAVPPTPNYRFPSSQGPQDTHGRDKSYGRNNNPYSNPPITDWREKTAP